MPNSREQIKEAYAGDIVAIWLKDTTRATRSSDPTKGETLAHFPEPVIDIASAKSKATRKRGHGAPSSAPRIRASRQDDEDPADHHLRHGRASPHIIVDRMKREFKWKPYRRARRA